MSEQTPAPRPETPWEGPIQLRWSDQDAYGHVNNVRLLTLTEEARVRAAQAWGEEADDGVLRFVRSMTTEYEAPVQYGPALTARVWVRAIGRTSYTLHHELWQDGRRCLISDAAMVVVDAATTRPVPHSDARRAVWVRRGSTTTTVPARSRMPLSRPMMSGADSIDP